MKLRAVSLICVLAGPVLADEGFWLFNQFPKAQVQEQYGVNVTDEFLESFRLATLRIGDGSGALVSPRGLVLTNQHLVSDCIAKAGPTGRDYLGNAFYASAQEEEIPCPSVEASILLQMQDVTQQVKEASKEAAKPAEALQKRNAAIARMEKACAESTGNVCAVVKLFSGERYDLYRYKRYTDLRLVFAPEFAVASFGGAPASLTYPRYGLDIAFLRAYENGRPADTPRYLKWGNQRIQEGDLVFAAGSPGSTSRMATAAQLTFFRDVSLPFTLSRIQRRIGDLGAFAAKSADNQRLAKLSLTSLASSYKLIAGRLIGLRDDWLMARKQNFEKKLRSAVEHDPKLGTEGGKVWDEVATAYKNWTPFEKQYQVLEHPAAEESSLFRFARDIVRLSEERGKPDEQRLPEYRDGASESVEAELYSPAPVEDSVEILLLTRYLEELRALGEREIALKAFGNKTSEQAAEELVRSTKLKDAAERKRLTASREAVADSDDAMIRLARMLEEPARKVRKKREETIEALDASSAERIAQYRYRVFGAADYPDGTSTLRATFGAVKSYRDRTEAPAPFATTFSGLYYLVTGQPPYALPERWMNAKALVDPVMPFDFASTCDITGGASGAPVVNTKGELTGITFDGNLESVAAAYLYSDDQARAVHVAAQSVVEALEKIYQAKALLRELGFDRDVPAGGSR